MEHIIRIYDEIGEIKQSIGEIRGAIDVLRNDVLRVGSHVDKSSLNKFIVIGSGALSTIIVTWLGVITKYIVISAGG